MVKKAKTVDAADKINELVEEVLCKLPSKKEQAKFLDKLITSLEEQHDELVEEIDEDDDDDDEGEGGGLDEDEEEEEDEEDEEGDEEEEEKP